MKIRSISLNSLNNSVILILLLSVVCLLAGRQSAFAQTNPRDSYIILGWNSLGMHCYNRDACDLMVLPPYNTLYVQVIEVNEPPKVITDGITVEYSFPDNTYSAGNPKHADKTNFWDNAKKLFDVNLPVNVGLAGKSLSGLMDKQGDHFVAVGIPLTEYRDIDARKGAPDTWKRYPYQLATVIVRDANTHKELARNIITAPVSCELNCAMCHADDGDATTAYPITPTGKVETNILALHDYLNPDANIPTLMSSRPVLCANCHSSNALSMAGKAGVSSLSRAMHNHHKNLDDITPDTAGCQNCHPGAQTQCLRDTMSQNFNLNCVTCHGDMNAVATKTDPWLNEPKCDAAACHGSGFALDQPLYRDSRGHGNLYCASCHDSPHAIAPSRERNDSIKFVYLTANRGPLDEYRVGSLRYPNTKIKKVSGLAGSPGTMRDCTVCHASTPQGPFKHGL
jgi:hypothetical protein